MTDVIRQWIVKKLGLPVSFSRGPDRVRKELSNGHLIGEILRKYHLISDDMLITLADSVCYSARVKNMKILHHWLDNQTSFEVDITDLLDISEGKPGAAVAFLYRMYLWLEGPGSEPGLHPRPKSEELPPPSADDEDVVNEFWVQESKKRYLEKIFPHVDKKDKKVGFMQPGDKETKTSSLFVNVSSDRDLASGQTSEIGKYLKTNVLGKISKSDPISETKLLKQLEESLASNLTSKMASPKRNVTPSSILSSEHKVTSTKGSGGTIPEDKLETSNEDKIHFNYPQLPSAQLHHEEHSAAKDYIEVDGNELFGHECGQMPGHYHRNIPFGNIDEEAQAGELYFHAKAVLLMQGQKEALERVFTHIPTSIAVEKHEYLGVYEAVEKARQERIEKRNQISKNAMMNEIEHFDKMLSLKPPNADEPVMEIYAHGRGDCTKATERIEALKSRRKKEKIYFEKRCHTRKILSSAYVKSITCDMYHELEKTIHDKLFQKSKPESSLANYYSVSHLEKTAFLEHIKVEQEQLLNMQMKKLANEVIHSQQLDEVEKKVNKIMEANRMHINNAIANSHRRAQLIESIKFCEELFILILKIAVRFSEYRSENGCDPPKEMVAEWKESLYLGNCTTSVPQQGGGSDADNIQLIKETYEDEKECPPNELDIKSKTNLRFIKLTYGNKIVYPPRPRYSDVFEETGEQSEYLGEGDIYVGQIQAEDSVKAIKGETKKSKKRKSRIMATSNDSIKLKNTKKNSKPDGPDKFSKTKSKMTKPRRSVVPSRIVGKVKSKSDLGKKKGSNSLNDEDNNVSNVDIKSEASVVSVKGKSKNNRHSLSKPGKPIKVLNEENLKGDERPGETEEIENPVKPGGKTQKLKNAGKQTKGKKLKK